MNSFNFPKQGKYFSEPSATFSLEPGIYRVACDTPQHKLTTPATKQANAIIPFASKPEKMKGACT